MRVIVVVSQTFTSEFIEHPFLCFTLCIWKVKFSLRLVSRGEDEWRQWKYLLSIFLTSTLHRNRYSECSLGRCTSRKSFRFPVSTEQDAGWVREPTWTLLKRQKYVRWNSSQPTSGLECYSGSSLRVPKDVPCTVYLEYTQNIPQRVW